MAVVHSKKTRILLGSLHVSPYAVSVEAGWQQNTLDTTVLTDTSKTFLLDDEEATFAAAGYHEIAAHPTFATWKASGASTPVTFGPSGFGHSSEVWLLETLNTAVNTSAARGQVAAFAITGQPTGPIDLGVSLHDLEAETADESGSSHDGSAATTGGAVAHLHVTAFSGISAADIIVEDSANNTDFATIGTFTQVTAATSQRLTIAGTVRRYTRYGLDVTGTGSITFQLSLARR